MKVNKKLKELESALVKLAEDVVNATGGTNLSACLSKDGVVDEFADAAWIHRQPQCVHICVPRSQSRVSIDRYYTSGMEFANRISVNSDIDFDATVKLVNDLRDAFNKNGLETLAKHKAEALAKERKQLIERLSAIDNNQL